MLGVTCVCVAVLGDDDLRQHHGLAAQPRPGPGEPGAQPPLELGPAASLDHHGLHHRGLISPGPGLASVLVCPW